MELDTANKANKGLAWQVPGIMRSLDIHYHKKQTIKLNAENKADKAVMKNKAKKAKPGILIHS